MRKSITELCKYSLWNCTKKIVVMRSAMFFRILSFLWFALVGVGSYASEGREVDKSGQQHFDEAYEAFAKEGRVVLGRNTVWFSARELEIASKDGSDGKKSKSIAAQIVGAMGLVITGGASDLLNIVASIVANFSYTSASSHLESDVYARRHLGGI